MRISMKARMAVAAMVDLAAYSDPANITIKSIADRHQVSFAYLEQVFCVLRRQGLVRSARGPGGGYTLGRAATELTVADVLAVMEPPLPNVADRLADPDDAHPPERMGDALWQAFDDCVHNYLASVTLESLACHLRPVPPPRVAKAYSLKKGIAQKKPVQTVLPNVPSFVFALGADPVT
jgi:Rrf2 family iron-sulfur cluster assembly transcriptional regulator